MATVKHAFIVVGRGEYKMDDGVRIPWFELNSPLGGEVIRATFGKDSPHAELHALPSFETVGLEVELRGNGKRSILGLATVPPSGPKAAA